MQRPDRYEGSSLAQSALHALLSLLPHFHEQFAAETRNTSRDLFPRASLLHFSSHKRSAPWRADVNQGREVISLAGTPDCPGRVTP